MRAIDQTHEQIFRAADFRIDFQRKVGAHAAVLRRGSTSEARDHRRGELVKREDRRRGKAGQNNDRLAFVRRQTNRLAGFERHAMRDDARVV